MFKNLLDEFFTDKNIIGFHFQQIRLIFQIDSDLVLTMFFSY